MVQITELSSSHFSSVVTLANQVHGDNYLDETNLAVMSRQGIKKGINASFVALDSNSVVVGFRLSFAPGQWQPDQWCSLPLWPVPANTMAYFKSVGVAESARGQGVASALLKRSVSALQLQGATAGLAHIWRESPGNAAELYFRHAGAALLKVHPNRWRHLSETVGYLCPICGDLCSCSAAEMVLTFDTDCLGD